MASVLERLLWAETGQNAAKDIQAYTVRIRLEKEKVKNVVVQIGAWRTF